MAKIHSSSNPGRRTYDLSATDRSRLLGFPSYEAYLDSDHWKEFKRRYRMAGRPWKCECCDRVRPGKMCLHHVSYQRLGQESFDDVRTLCNWCHKELHKIHREQGIALEHFGMAVAYLRKRIMNAKFKQAQKSEKQEKWSEPGQGQSAKARSRRRKRELQRQHEQAAQPVRASSPPAPIATSVSVRISVTESEPFIPGLPSALLANVRPSAEMMAHLPIIRKMLGLGCTPFQIAGLHDWNVIQVITAVAWLRRNDHC